MEKTNSELLQTNRKFFGYIPTKIGTSQFIRIREKINDPKIKEDMIIKMYFNLNIDQEKGCWVEDDWTTYGLITFAYIAFHINLCAVQL
jgi:hypothetical protein